MSLEFEDGYGVLLKNNPYTERVSRFASFLIRHHLSRNENDANKILIIITIFFFISTFVLIFFYTQQNSGQKTVKYNFSSTIIKNLPKDTQIEVLSH